LVAFTLSCQAASSGVDGGAPAAQDDAKNTNADGTVSDRDAGDARQPPSDVEQGGDEARDTGPSQGDGTSVIGDADASFGGVSSPLGACTPDGRWCLDDPYPMGGSLDSIWAASSNDVWVSGEIGTMHYDGTAWTRYFFRVQGLFGTSSTDVWANVLSFNSGGTPSGSPDLMHWDGSHWSRIQTGAAVNLAGVWASSPTDVFVIGPAGTILHFDGVSWTTQASGTTSDLYLVWGFQPYDVWAAGDSGVVIHYDGASWSPNSPGILTMASRGHLWGSFASDLWLCYSNENPYHWRGRSWSPVTQIGGVDQCMGRATKDDVLFTSGSFISAGGGQVFLQWTSPPDGGIVQVSLPPQTPGSLEFPILASTRDEYFVGMRGSRWGGNGLAHGVPASWTSYTQGTIASLGGCNGLSAIWNAGGGTYYAVTGSGVSPNRHLVSTARAQWSTKGYIGTDHVMHAMWGSGLNDVWAVGDSGVATHYDGTAWTAQSLQTANLTDVWGSGPNDFWATGGASYHWDGRQWTATGPGGAIVSGTASNDVWLAGGSSASHWDGSAWTAYKLDLAVSTNIIIRLNAFTTNNAWLVTSLGDVFHWDGTSWLGKADAYCPSAVDGGSCATLAPVGSGGLGFVWNGPGDGWASILGPEPWGALWHTTGANFSSADVVINAPPGVDGFSFVFGGPSNAWTCGNYGGMWKLD
jgi:hypothetical protein